MSITKTFLQISELKNIIENHPDHCDHTDESCGCEHKDKDEATEKEDLNYWTGFED